jgi:hypothetical protein
MKRTLRNVIISKLKEVLTAIEENIVGGTAIALENQHLRHDIIIDRENLVRRHSILITLKVQIMFHRV